MPLIQENKTRADMLGMLTAIHENSYGHLYLEVNRQELNYVIYLRKSSDESSDKQTKSISDQFADIKDRVLEPNKITNYTIVKEEHSAKESDTRFEFSKMLVDLRTRKYQGLIAWHADRLARNMKEAGEIIDMLDKNIIKDLLFATATYENSATGKMMLGITFALSKQYSEHLSESVLRGYSRRIDEGKYLGKMVHGYRILEDGILEPDGNNWLIIQQAFRMRLQSNKESNSDIAKWLNKQDYTQCYGRKQKRSRVIFNDKKVSEMLRETIYCGFLQYGVAKPVDLVELYRFEAMITVDEFLRINRIDKLERIVAKGNVLTKTKLINLLKGKVTCGHCGSYMHSNSGTGKMGRTYVYFRCDSKDCIYKISNETNPQHYKHQIRAHFVTDAAIETLTIAQFDLKKAYKNYVLEQKKAVESENIELLSQERRIMANKQQTELDLERAKNVVADSTKAEVASYYQSDIKKYIDIELPKYELELADIKQRQKVLNDSVVSEEKFIKLMQSIGDYLSNLKDLDQINEILEKFYSNFIITNKAVSVIEFNQEWYDVLNPAWLAIVNESPTNLFLYSTA